MGLNWDVTACADSAALRTEEQWPFTENLIFSTMAIGMGTITEDNIGVFAARLEAYATVYGPLFMKMLLGEAVPRTVTVEDLRPYIGLRVNVTFESDAKFKNRMARELMERAGKATR